MARAKTNRPKECPYVGKGGLKLAFALEQFHVAVHGLVVADLGSHIGGFADCLLQAGAARLYAVDTAYGLLAWKIRTDPRVEVHERTNVLHWSPPEPVDLVVSDLGWTKQALALPVIVRMLKPGGLALVLVKPQYEAEKRLLHHGVLPEEQLPAVLEQVHAAIPPELSLAGEVRSPVLGSGGNIEYWWKLVRGA